MPPTSNVPDTWERDNGLWRVQRLEDDFSKLSVKIDGVTAALGAGLSAIGTQIAALQVSMPDHYVPRREYDVSHKLLDERIKTIEATQSKALWLVLGTLLTALTSVGLGLLGFKGLAGHG